MVGASSPFHTSVTKRHRSHHEHQDTMFPESHKFQKQFTLLNTFTKGMTNKDRVLKRELSSNRPFANAKAQSRRILNLLIAHRFSHRLVIHISRTVQAKATLALLDFDKNLVHSTSEHCYEPGNNLLSQVSTSCKASTSITRFKVSQFSLIRRAY